MRNHHTHHPRYGEDPTPGLEEAGPRSGRGPRRRRRRGDFPGLPAGEAEGYGPGRDYRGSPFDDDHGPGQGAPREGQGRRRPDTGEGKGRGGHHGGGRGRGPRKPGGRAGRGEIRVAILGLLAEQPMHGYQLIQEIADRSGGRWHPSPGAIYPALSLLEDEGLITITADSGRKLAELTELGSAHLADHPEAHSAPWDERAGLGAHPGHGLRGAMQALGSAARQVARTGTPAQATAALAVLDAARRELYLILAGQGGDAATASEGVSANGEGASPDVASADGAVATESASPTEGDGSVS